MAKVLSGITILDLTQFLAGTYGTQLLAGMGADVIKIENPKGGAPERSSPPFAGPNGVSIGRETPEDMSFSHLKRSRNKRSITLNLKAPEGRALFLEMVKKADAVVENFRPGTMEKLGLGYDVLKAANPQIVYCSLTGFGKIEAYQDLPAFDIVVQAMSGAMATNGFDDKPPARESITVGDLSAGLYACVGTLAALLHRFRTGEGNEVSVSMIEGILSLLMDEAPDFWMSQGFRQRDGSRLTRMTPFNVFEAKDGYYVVAAGTDDMWRKILAAIGREDLKDDPRYLKGADRSKRTYEIDDIINAWSKDLPADEAVAALAAHGIPTARVKDYDEAINDENLLNAGVIKELEHPTAGTIQGAKVWENPLHFSSGDTSFDRPAPVLGSANEDVYLKWLGVEEGEYAELKGKGVI